MPTHSEQIPFSSVLDHYGGFAPNSATQTQGTDPNRMAYLRRDSDRSLHSNASSSHAPLSRIHAVDAAFPQPSPINTPSVRSSSSSLRQTVDMLKAGVFPPGLQRIRSRGESSSDGSHYDDDDESEEQGFRMEKGDPFGSAHSRGNSASGNADIFSNALDSPSVPLRRSSQHSSLHAKRGSNGASIEDHEGDKRRSEEEVVPSAVAAANAFAGPSHSPTFSSKSTPPKKSTIPTMTRTLTGDSPALSTTQKEMDWEKALALAAEKDPNRPKTLKEARAFAKERARLRLQAREGGDSSSSAIQDTMPAQAIQREISKQSSSSIEAEEVRTPDSSSEWRGHSRELATLIPSKGEEVEQVRAVDAMSMPEKSSAHSMEDLQSAVGEALQDLSFSSSTATGETMREYIDTAADIPASSSTTMKLDIPTSRGDIEDESSAMSITSFTSAQDFASTQDSMPKSRRTSLLQSLDHDTGYSSAQDEAATPAAEAIDTPVIPLSPSTVKNVERSPEAATFVPHRLHTQQRSTAPNKIARLDIYGKTVPWPPAFDPAAIIEQRRLAPWERARSYAHYCNDLSSTPSGLQVWMEMVQRPANRVAEPATPVKKHLRGEATDHSGYAASVRSDATFPMRGDGGRAKELVSHIPAIINDSPPNLLPHNIPYPMLVQQANRRSSISLEDNVPSPASERNVSRPGFFTSLGRRGSTARRTPGSGSLSGFTSLSSSASSNTIRARGKPPKVISSPMNLSSSPSIANIKSDQYATSPDATSSPSPLGTQQSRYAQPSSPSISAPPSRTPLGPRAPVSTPSINLPDDRAQRRTSTASAASNDKAGPITDYSASSTGAASKSSLSYASVRDNLKRSPKLPQQVTSSSQGNLPNSSDSGHSKSNTSSRRGSHQMAPPTTAENVALDKLADVLPDAERATLLEHLRKAGNNDLLAIGSYLQENALSEGKVFLR